MDKDPYSVLGLAPDATEADAKRAFRELARKYHPDSEFGDAEKMAEIDEAYEAIVRGRATREKEPVEVDERTIVDDVEEGEEEEAHTFSAQAARVFGEFGCFASNYEEIHGGPPQESGKMHKAYTQIRNMDLEDAVDTLESIGTSNRNGRWYYYYAMADLLLGEHEEALRFAGRAAQEAPNNVEIQDFYQKTVQVIRDWLKKHPEDGPEILFTRERLIRFCIGLAIFLVLAFFIYWKTGVITF